MDIRKLEYFYYSQNSINAFIKCPLKFRLKYLENLSWKREGSIEENYYENIKQGLDFHLICERYFAGIPLGKLNNDDLIKKVNSLKDTFKIDRKNDYLVEYEVKMTKDVMRLQAKYDLILVTPDKKIQIWDWKTENRKLSIEEMKKRVQTLVYMYVLAENVENMFGFECKLEDITMNFWQPQYENNIITIGYSKRLILKMKST
ncbi:PD-(D/E)XK nuclease family protein [Clostridium ljungdahlii]|uniref:PD-(D/E)XK nuclease family protein n=1 Tax=Clostridium ljungdahlii TaxID=1538 RepID=UPI00386726A8